MTGYLRDPESAKDWRFDRLAGSMPADTPSAVNLESLFGPAFDQGRTHQCVAYAMAAIKRFHEYRESGQWLNFDAQDLYDKCKLADGAPGQEGTYIRTALDITRVEGMQANVLRERFRIGAHVRLSSPIQIVQAIATGHPVLAGVMFDMSALWGLHPHSPEVELTPEPTGGHAIVIVGYDDDRKAFRVRNSWGCGWCDHGHFWMPYSYLTESDPRFDAWTVADEATS